MIPTLQFADHHQPRTGAASIAVIAASAVAIVEPEAVFAAAERARAVSVLQKPCFNTKLRQYLSPAISGALDRFVVRYHDRLDCDFA